MASAQSDLEAYDLKLYHMFPVRSTRVVWLIHELDVVGKVEIESLDMFKGDHKKPSFLAINKMGSIPVLVVKQKDGDKTMVMTESSGICIWLTDIARSTDLKPLANNVFGLGQYYRFITFAASSMDPLLWDIRMHEQLLPEGRRIKQVADTARNSFLRKVIPTLEEVFSNKDDVKFICEPYHKGFTTADVIVGYALYWSTLYGLLEDSKPLRGYLRRLMTRKEFQAATTRNASL